MFFETKMFVNFFFKKLKQLFFIKKKKKYFAGYLDIIAKLIKENVYETFLKDKNEYFEITAININQRKQICQNVQYIIFNEKINIIDSIGIYFTIENTLTTKKKIGNKIYCSFIELDCKILSFFIIHAHKLFLFNILKDFYGLSGKKGILTTFFIVTKDLKVLDPRFDENTPLEDACQFLCKLKTGKLFKVGKFCKVWTVSTLKLPIKRKKKLMVNIVLSITVTQ